MKEFLKVFMPLWVFLALALVAFYVLSPKTIKVCDIVYSTGYITRVSAFKSTSTYLYVKDKDVHKALDEMWKDYIHSDDPQEQEKYLNLVNKVVVELTQQLGPDYKINTPGDNISLIQVINVRKENEERQRLDKIIESVSAIGE